MVLIKNIVDTELIKNSSRLWFRVPSAVYRFHP
jgi:hypothetical protein